MDELACPERISTGSIVCVDCCALGHYLFNGPPSDGDTYGCAIGHHETVVFDEAEWKNIAQAIWETTRVDQTAREAFNDAMIRDWLLEIYTAYTDQAKQPRIERVSSMLYDVPGSYGGQRDLVGDLMSDPDDMTKAQKVQIASFLRSNRIPADDWLSGTPDTFLVVINRRAV